jgi:hypothetical protein
MWNFLNKNIVVIIISLIWGFGMSLMFRKACINGRCVVVKVPPAFLKANGIIYDKHERCYKLEKYLSPCVY